MNQIEIYNSSDNKVELRVSLDKETVWLKHYLVKGYAVNQQRLEQLHQTIQLISRGGKTEDLQLQEAKGLLDIIQNYTQSFVLLNQYDSNSIKTGKLNEHITYEIKYPEA